MERLASSIGAPADRYGSNWHPNYIRTLGRSTEKVCAKVAKVLFGCAHSNLGKVTDNYRQACLDCGAWRFSLSAYGCQGPYVGAWKPADAELEPEPRPTAAEVGVDTPGVGIVHPVIATPRTSPQTWPTAPGWKSLEETLIALIFSARGMAEASIHHITGSAGELCWTRCLECGWRAQATVPLIHSEACNTGRVLEQIAALAAMTDSPSNPNRKEDAPAEGEGRAGDGIRSRGDFEAVQL
jgi:hypothetical protein